MSLVQRRGIGDALAALLRGEGIDEQMSRTDQSLLHGNSRLDGEQFIHQLGIDAAAKLRQRFGQDKVRLGTIRLDLTQTTGVHHRYIGAQTLADVFIGGTQFVFEQFQGEQHPV